jgi:hypothetical protein
MSRERLGGRGLDTRCMRSQQTFPKPTPVNEPHLAQHAPQGEGAAPEQEGEERLPWVEYDEPRHHHAQQVLP